MIRVGVLLMLFAIGRAQAETPAGGDLDLGRLTAVYSDALTFIAPRILDPVSMPQLTMWGLQGLAMLDPAVRVVAKHTRLQLFRQDQMMADVPAPKDETAISWAQAAGALTAAGFSASSPIRRAG
ncbi:MAG: hypothetical protein M3Y22_11675, partial [Pseudomonadota bacterium]|nr:hypothetical protein [Pseudomonadota bacterium]